MLFRQFFDRESCTYTYLLAADINAPAVLIDPVLENIPQYIRYLNEVNGSLTYAIDTHIHADHITALGQLRELTGCHTILAAESGLPCISLGCHHQQWLHINADLTLQCLYTPGHTNDSYSFYCPQLKALFTGDTLLYRGSGRTDFQNGDAGLQYDSITQCLFQFPNDTLVYAGHDYKGQTVSTIGEEKKFNPRLNNQSRENYITLMANLNLPHPKMMDIAIPRNRLCGMQG